MVLVFLGHILEAFWLAGYTSSFLSYKFIYSFHIPLFFFLSGYVARPTKQEFGEYLRTKLFPRLIVPFLFFNLVVLLCSVLADSLTGSVNLTEYIQGGLALLRGMPAFNVLTWFLVCLFSVKLIDFIVTRFVRSKYLRLFVASVLFLGGWLVTLKYEFLVLDVWLFPEALVAYLFFCLGSALKHQRWFSQDGRLRNFVGFCVSAVLTLITFNLNRNNFIQDAFASDSFVVNMALSDHGQPLLFLITALTGSLGIIYLGRWCTQSASIRFLQARFGIEFIGLNTLIYLGLNGLLMPFK